VEVATATELIAKWEEPAARERRKLFSGEIVAAVRPHEILARSRRAPRSQRLTADERTKHLALDLTATGIC
jgi:hypothetical protein